MKTSTSVAKNKDPILEVLKLYVTKDEWVLEIGSGTGEHATFFAKHLPQSFWYTSDVKENHKDIVDRLARENLKNVDGPVVLKIGVDDFPKKTFQYVFTANTLHIMSWKECKTLFKLLGKRLREGGLTFFYGPFNYNNEYTSEGNEQFDAILKEQNPACGIRDFEDVCVNMKKAGFRLLKDHVMPANNRILVFERLAHFS
jgi:cyclopropane fatty-acyl-phospholipid synthase-like methyltransferase